MTVTAERWAEHFSSDPDDFEIIEGQEAKEETEETKTENSDNA